MHPRTLAGLIAALLLAVLPAFAGKTVLIPLEDDCESVQRVVRAVVEEVVATERRMTLPDGSPGPVLEWQYEYACLIEEVVAGEPLANAERVQIRYGLTSDTSYDEHGKALVTRSRIRSGSGLEPQLKKGERYLLLLSTVEPAAGAHLLHRAEAPERIEAVREALVRGRCWRALRPAGIVRESAQSVAWDSQAGILYVCVRRGAERDVYRVDQATGSVGKASLAGDAAQFERLAIDSEGVLLMGAGYNPHGKTVARVLRAGDFAPVPK